MNTTLRRVAADALTTEITPTPSPRRLPPPPAVFTRQEVQALLSRLDGVAYVVAALLYGSGLRLSEALGLRIGDIDFDRRRITVRDGKGERDRTAPLPTCLVEPMRRQIVRSRCLMEDDRPANGDQPRWLFPAEGTGFAAAQRPRLAEDGIQRAVRKAALRAGIATHGGCQTLRHSCAAHLLEDGCELRKVQTLLGHSDPRQTQVYLRVAQIPAPRAYSPLDAA